MTIPTPKQLIELFGDTHYFGDYSYLSIHVDDNTNPDFIGNTVDPITETLTGRTETYYPIFRDIGNDILLKTESETIDVTNHKPFLIGSLQFAILQLQNYRDTLITNATR